MTTTKIATLATADTGNQPWVHWVLSFQQVKVPGVRSWGFWVVDLVIELLPKQCRNKTMDFVFWFWAKPRSFWILKLATCLLLFLKLWRFVGGLYHHILYYIIKVRHIILLYNKKLGLKTVVVPNGFTKLQQFFLSCGCSSGFTSLKKKKKVEILFSSIYFHPIPTLIPTWLTECIIGTQNTYVTIKIIINIFNLAFK